jgi:hypothetical protein
MSLIASASLWTADDPNTKRTPTLRKTIKKTPYIQSVGQPSEYISQQNYQNVKEPLTIDETEVYQDTQNSRVNELLNKITAIDVENDGSGLANFNPIPLPEINKKKNANEPSDSTNKTFSETDEHEDLHRTPSFYNDVPLGPTVRKPADSSNYSANNINLAKLSNYHSVYDPSKQTTAPYYAKMGLANSSSGLDNKLLEKINYMVHLLEQQQDEKTNHVMEEFILYVFLGVFVIFIVDSFARAGKYTR